MTDDLPVLEWVGESEGWRDKLIYGDNKTVLAALRHGSLRRQIENLGGVKLIYIDPPFATGLNFSMRPVPGGFAYADAWAKGMESYLAMLEARLTLMREVMAPEGCIYVHCDWRANARLRLLLDKIFPHYVNEIIWHYTGGGRSGNYFSRKHDSIFLYALSGKFVFNGDDIRVPYKDTSAYAKKGIVSKAGKKYLPNPLGAIPDDVWDLPIINPLARERTGYPTQKPESLLERIIRASSNPGDLVADFFCGSGTTAVVAQKLGRKWLAVDRGRLAIHTCRKRLLNMKIQTDFEILSVPGYEDLRGENMSDIILRAYGAEKSQGQFRGLKNNRLVVICAGAATGDVLAQAGETDILAREFTPEFFASYPQYKKNVRAFYIPDEIFIPGLHAQPEFMPVPDLEIKIDLKDGAVRVELTAFGSPARADIGSSFADCWAVDFAYNGEIFHGEWHASRARHGSLDTASPWKKLDPGFHLIAVKAFNDAGHEGMAFGRVNIAPAK